MMLVNLINQSISDMRLIAQSGNWTLEAQVRAYDLLELLCDSSEAPHVIASREAMWQSLTIFRQEYSTLSPALEKAYDEASLRALSDQHLQPYKDALAKAEAEVARLTDLHECAKSTFDIWQSKGVFAKLRAISILRSKAGFRLETKRIGNYVAKTYDLMNEARAAYGCAQQKLFAADLSYKIKPGVYAEIHRHLSSVLSKDNPLA